ncbi:hypothetical protein R0131_02585 [Clostridium sp. AL.422]|uniref:hypothetical protein n=1 Tax=Clostridium TaxID=1485 RepID=UPI00293DC21B|nr:MULTISPECIES: hypothetical protein [unclassified Clostridium]MDV4149713.1 hypothetical protein [Clostridium sp. AL.422]
MNNNILKLKNMYLEKSKHSNYQIIPKRLRGELGNLHAKVKETYEEERLNYILSKIDLKYKTILDIGGNIGFFTFEMIDNGVKTVHYFEGNKNHSEFVKLATKVAELEDKIKVTNKYYLFDNIHNINEEKYDITLLLNVVHHIGEDYGDNNISINNAKKNILQQINNLSLITETLIFQLGFNWKGNVGMNLFCNGTKKEMINYIVEGTKDYWEVIHIGIPEFIEEKIKYCDLNNKNIERNNELGEFLNRPIFIMKSSKCL